MNSWKVICATLVIFITGVVTGGLLVSYADRASRANRLPRQRAEARLPGNSQNLPPMTNARDPQSPRFPNPLQNRLPRGVNLEFLQKLDAEVHLTPGQHERIEQIITDGQLRNKEIMEPVTPELRRELMETQKRIREILTPDQHARFEELMKQSRPANRRQGEEPLPAGSRPRDQRRPLPPRDAPENLQPAPRDNP